MPETPATNPAAGMQTAPSDTPEATAIRQRVIDKIAAKQGGFPVCPVCHQNTFSLGPFVHLQVAKNPSKIELGTVMPCATLVCSTCGHVMLMGLLLLGFSVAELASLAPPDG
jgi:hypothetical protein